MGGGHRRPQSADRRADANLAVLARWVRETDWAAFLAKIRRSRSNTSVCLKIVDPWFAKLAPEAQAAAAKKIADLLDKEGAALDIASYRSAPPGLRIWCGATVERSDLEALTPWLDWAWAQVKAELNPPPAPSADALRHEGEVKSVWSFPCPRF
jgi:phosphoserine aminotransferase